MPAAGADHDRTVRILEQTAVMYERPAVAHRAVERGTTAVFTIGHDRDVLAHSKIDIPQLQAAVAGPDRLGFIDR